MFHHPVEQISCLCQRTQKCCTKWETKHPPQIRDTTFLSMQKLDLCTLCEQAEFMSSKNPRPSQQQEEREQLWQHHSSPGCLQEAQPQASSWGDAASRLEQTALQRLRSCSQSHNPWGPAGTTSRSTWSNQIRQFLVSEMLLFIGQNSWQSHNFNKVGTCWKSWSGKYHFSSDSGYETNNVAHVIYWSSSMCSASNQSHKNRKKSSNHLFCHRSLHSKKN